MEKSWETEKEDRQGRHYGKEHWNADDDRGKHCKDQGEHGCGGPGGRPGPEGDPAGGRLQRNKVKQVVGHVALIQSVGSLELLDEIEKVAAARDLVQDILLEVNIGREAAKSGFAPEDVLAGAEAALERPHVRVRGLMTIPPADAERDANFRYFQEVQALYVDMNKKLFHNELEYLSMGMSGDYEDAIRAGATMVRVGSAIFGARHYN